MKTRPCGRIALLPETRAMPGSPQRSHRGTPPGTSSESRDRGWHRGARRAFRAACAGAPGAASAPASDRSRAGSACRCTERSAGSARSARPARSEEHTSELQSSVHLVCRLLLEKKKTNHRYKILIIKVSKRAADEKTKL